MKSHRVVEGEADDLIPGPRPPRRNCTDHDEPTRLSMPPTQTGPAVSGREFSVGADLTAQDALLNVSTHGFPVPAQSVHRSKRMLVATTRTNPLPPQPLHPDLVLLTRVTFVRRLPSPRHPWIQLAVIPPVVEQELFVVR